MYYNARSVLPKIDELLLSVDIQRPDVICITESWLCSDIQNSEIAIPGYQSLRLDRNRHGDGILMYVSERFIVKRLPPCPSLELLPVTLHCGNCRICLSLFYHPPPPPPPPPVHQSKFCTLYIIILNQLTFHSFLVLYLSETLI